MLSDYFHFLQLIVTSVPFALFDLVILLCTIIYLKQEKALGILQSSVSLVKILVSFALSVAVYPFISSALISTIRLSKGTADAMALFVVVSLLLVISTLLLRKILFEDEQLEGAMRYIPLITGLLSFFILLSFTLSVLISLPSSRALKSFITASPASRFAVEKLTIFDLSVRDLLSVNKSEAMNAAITSSSDNSPTVLNYPASIASYPDNVNEQLLDDINKIRFAVKRNSLSIKKPLSALASKQADDIVGTGILSTISSRGLSVDERMISEGMFYADASEIVVSAPFPELVIPLILRDNGAKRILLHTLHRDIGIAVLHTDKFGDIYVLDFAH